MTSRTQYDEYTTDELVEAAYETDSVLAHAVAEDLESTAADLLEYHAIGSVDEIKAALEAARRASLLLDLHARQDAPEVVKGTQALNAALLPLKF